MTKVLATYGPYTYAQAKDKTKLEKSMTSECNSLTKNKTWTLIPLSHGNNLVGCKWIYKTKFTLEGNIEKHKARFVAKCFSQQQGIDYTKNLALVAKMNTIRTILSLDTYYQWEIHQMDVNILFLNGDIHHWFSPLKLQIWYAS